MRTRLFPDGTAVTAVGVGDFSLATASARNVDAGEVARALSTALELGITFVDLAAEPDAERLAGGILRAHRDRVVVQTRADIVDEEVGSVMRDVPIERLPVQARVEASLRATRLDVLPLVQLALRPHWLHDRTWPELVETCERLVREGKVQRWSATHDTGGDPPPPPRDPEEPLPPSALDAPWLVAIAMPLSMCERKAPRPVDKLLLARRPLAGGALAGALGPGAKFAVRDDRKEVGAEMLERYAIMAARLAHLVKQVPPSARSCETARGWLDAGAQSRPKDMECETLAELALRWTIDRGALALPRLHRKEHVMEALVAAMAPPLSGDPVS